MSRIRTIILALAVLVGFCMTAGVKASTLTGGMTFSTPWYSDNGQVYLAYTWCPFCMNGSSSNILYTATQSNPSAYWTSVSDLNGCTPVYGNHVPQQWRASPATTVMQYDGNFVLYHTGEPNYAAWATNTDGNSGAYISIQNDGNLVVYTSSNVPIWALNCS
jgi:hypothetical protein